MFYHLTFNSSRGMSKKIETGLDLSDLGAGYDIKEKRVAAAVNYYEEKLLPYIHENHGLFKSTNFLMIKGYATSSAGKKHSHDD